MYISKTCSDSQHLTKILGVDAEGHQKTWLSTESVDREEAVE